MFEDRVLISLVPQLDDPPIFGALLAFFCVKGCKIALASWSI